MLKKSIIFDLDNTLVRCSEYYIDAKHKFADMMCLETGIDPNSAINVLTAIDIENLRMKGVAKDRYPCSFEAASTAIDTMMGRKISSKRAKKAWRLGNAVFRAPYPLYDGAYEALKTLADKGYDLFICTKGDPQVQLRKIYKNKINKIIPEGHIYVDLRKTQEHFKRIVQEHRIRSKDLIVVGDSIKDDISSGKFLKATTVHVTVDEVQWAYEDVECKPDYSITTIAELPELLDKIKQ